MKDPLWQEVYRALLDFLRRDDAVLLPFGDWPDLPCKTSYYGDLISIDDATVFVLHKGRFGAIDKATLRRIADSWQCIFGNGVFLCFSKDFRARRDIRRGRSPIDHRVLQGRFPPNALRRFLQSKALRRRTSHIWYIHLPKAAGTSMWQSVSQAFPARIYYGSATAFSINPPDIDEYDLIGGHLRLSLITRHLAAEDWVIGLMREPTERLRSAFLHSRRPNADPLTFTATMRAMRDMPFAEFIRTGDGQLEARQQLIMLGYDDGAVRSSPDDLDCLERAKAILSSDRFLFAPCTRADDFLNVATGRSHIRARHSQPLNTSTYEAQLADINEFNESLEQTLLANAGERRLYEFVVKRFADLSRDPQCRASGFKSWRHLVGDARHQAEKAILYLDEIRHRARAAMIAPRQRR